ncbi:MAG: 50S ribosomal protein L21 [Planctomycetaceae bacterium]
MFAIIEESGSQMQVSEGDLLQIDFRADAEAGQEVVFDKVLIANGGGASVIGRPVIDAATVTGTVVNPLAKGPKLYIQKFRRRKTFRKRTGHRQKYTMVKITGIKVPGLEIVQKQDQPAAAE